MIKRSIEWYSKFAANRRLNQAINYLQRNGGRSDITDWITPELLEKHETFPYHLAPNSFRSYVMNLNNPEDISLWNIGKALQRKHGFNVIDGETVAEVQAGFWAVLIQEVLMVPVEEQVA